MSWNALFTTALALLAAANSARVVTAAELLGGPMVGHTTDTTTRVWARSDGDAEMVVAVSTSPELSDRIQSGSVRMLRSTDWTGVAEVKGLRPGTIYYYDIFLDGQKQLKKPLPSFRTFPPAGEPARVRVLFGGGIRFQLDPVQQIWDVMALQDADAFISMGDNVYPDPWNPILNQRYFQELDLGGNERLMQKRPFDDLQQKRYYYARDTNGPLEAFTRVGPGYLYHRVYYRIQQSIPSQRRFVAHVPTYAVWDDHDAYHDGTGGAQIPMALRLESIQTFRENFANPYYGDGDKTPGTWCHFGMADLEFFLLDARTYRDYSQERERRFLGTVEERWLKDRLLNSQATFKFIVCGSPWNNQPKGGTRLTEQNYYAQFGDTLASFKWQRDELLKFIVEHRIPGVVLLSGDRHRAEVVRVWPRGHQQQVFYDLSNCNIASATHRAAGEIGENGLVYVFSGYTFGVLDVDTVSKPATVTYSIWGTKTKEDPAGRVHQIVLQATDFLPIAAR